MLPGVCCRSAAVSLVDTVNRTLGAIGRVLRGQDTLSSTVQVGGAGKQQGQTEPEHLGIGGLEKMCLVMRVIRSMCSK